ncbi:hypothetical protein WAI453_002071 [Rhynchosporium graminicola]|uniref:F-box domain-containing protein n=1 Tax=Rhynchosporium graminicola TaxID=2792576 RepID=A0A1E1KWD4_9HELO|nr:uncharacterized protein RCO7_06264 [Rhynchosporium commune]
MPPKAMRKVPPKTPKAKPPLKKQSTPQPPPAPKPTKRKRSPSDSPSPPTPEWDKGITSLASRKRAQFQLSRASFQEELDANYIEREALKLSAESANSWGSMIRSPIRGTRRPKARCRGLRRRRAGTLGLDDAYLEMFNAMAQQRREPIENCLDSTPILRIPLEIRERIYGYLLVYPDPIMVKDDWRSVERNSFVDHSLMLGCKQFAFEASSFVYRNNTFRSLVRVSSSNPALRFEPPGKLPSFAHSLLRNIIIDCSKTCWNLDWHEKVAEGLGTLVQAKAVIDALILIVVPQRVGMSHTALGMEKCPVTFADFLWHAGPCMRAVCKLAPKTFKIVVKKPRKMKLGIEIDLTILRNWDGDEGICDQEALRIRKEKVKILTEELEGLKRRFEEVFEDDELALRKGLCEMISPRDMGRDEDDLVGFGRLGSRQNRDGDGEAERGESERSSSEEIWAT